MIASSNFTPVYDKAIEFGGGLQIHQVPGVSMIIVFCICYQHWPTKPRPEWLEDLSFVDLADILQEEREEQEEEQEDNMFFDFKANFRRATIACVRTHVPTVGRVDDIPAAGFLLMKCSQLDEINVNYELVKSQLWQIDRDFLELADALVVVPTGNVD